MRIAALPPPGINSDDTSYSAPGVWADGDNCRFFLGRPESVGNETDLQSGALETYSFVKALFAYKAGGNIKLAVAGSLLYSTNVNASPWTRTDITPAAGWQSDVSTSFAMFGDVLLVSQNNGTIYSSTAGAQAVAVANAPANINRMLVTPSRQVMALGCNEEISATFNGRCIRWSDIGTTTTWATLSSNNAGEYILPGQHDIVSACLLGDYIVIWTSAALWLGQYIGQPGQTFVFTRVADIGIANMEAFAVYEGAVYWMDKRRTAYVYQPGSTPAQIPCQVSGDFFSLSSTSSLAVYAVAHHRYGEIWFFYYVTQNSAPTRYIAYCVEESQRNQRPIWFKGIKSAQALIDDPLLLGMGGDSTCIRIAAGASQKLIAFDRQDGGGTPPTGGWSITSSDYYADEGMRRVMVTRYIHDVERQDANATVTVRAKDHPNGSLITQAQTVTASNTKTDYRIGGKLISYLISGTDLFRLGKPAFDVVALGER